MYATVRSKWDICMFLFEFGFRERRNKGAGMKNRQISIWMGALSIFLFVVLALPLTVMAEDEDDYDDRAEEAQTFTQEQLAQLLAPIALYPDELIAQVLLASTYPLEVVMADRWVERNKDLKGDALATALERETWAPSVKALVNFPSVLAMLSQKLDLTTKLGDAFLEQKEDVTDMIQELRKKAADAGNLKSTMQQNVVIEKEKILIEPSDTRVIYVPTYDPYLVYGPWWYPAYPPYYFYSPPYPGVVFSFGVGVTLGMPWGYAWGGWDWYGRNVVINVNRNIGYNSYIDRSRYIRRYERRGLPVQSGQVIWRHDPGHRRGVAYKDKGIARKFGQLPARPGEVRRESRGFSTTGRTVQGGGGVQVPVRRSNSVVSTGVVEQKTRKDAGAGAQVTSPKTLHESVFTGGDSNSSQIRKSSERGRQSVGETNVYRTQPQSGRGSSVGIPRSGGGGSGGGDFVPRRGRGN